MAAVLDALVESLQLQGARGLDLARATSGDTSDEELPELRLNVCLVSEVFVQILATGVGTLAFIWATSSCSEASRLLCIRLISG